MSVDTLFEELGVQGVRLRVGAGAGIGYTAPQGVMTTELAGRIKENRAEILDTLKAYPPKVNDVYYHRPACACWICIPDPGPGSRWACLHGSIPNSCPSCRGAA